MAAGFESTDTASFAANGFSSGGTLRGVLLAKASKDPPSAHFLIRIFLDWFRRSRIWRAMSGSTPMRRHSETNALGTFCGKVFAAGVAGVPDAVWALADKAPEKSKKKAQSPAVVNGICFIDKGSPVGDPLIRSSRFQKPVAISDIPRLYPRVYHPWHQPRAIQGGGDSTSVGVGDIKCRWKPWGRRR